ncbi:hypothetical protein B0T10DRAFT_561574 [Thelonectria olida]|uniref:Uncharacterized protein n=1 Tax=Thelonectria olida TaxID=1576542 RepID=A0A9P8W4N9_9HYPO|nr:hypothetical protein B0T10DRAFT_561574 [Thelonectria olida]
MTRKTDVATRALIVTLKSSLGGKTTAEIAEITGISTRTINSIYARAIERGFNPNHRPLTLRDEYLRDAGRAGRPKKQTDERRDEVIAKLRIRDFCHYSVEDPSKSWVPEDEADQEAWIDEENEASPA